MSWYILDKLFKYDAMPNLKRIAKNSLRGVLKSTVSPYTPPAWTSIAAGVNPGKHGIFGFIKLTNNCGSRVLNSNDVRYPRIHEMVALAGLKSVCINLPLTYPIIKMRKIMVISDWMSPNLTFYPKSIKNYAKDYHPYLISHIHKAPNYFNRLLNESTFRVNAVNSMMEELDWNLFWVIYSEPDNVMHENYNGIINGYETALKIFSKIDETIEKAVQLADLVIILSDHGFSKFNYLISVNTLLYKLGLVVKTWKKPIKEFVDHPKGEIRHIRVPVKLYGILSLKPIKFLSKKIFRLLSGGRELRGQLPCVDVKRSIAFYLSHFNGVWVKNQNLIEPLINAIRDVKGVKNVWKREKIFHGPYVNLAPHIIFSPDYDDGYQTYSSSIYPDIVVKNTVYDHHPDGIFIASGRKISSEWIGHVKCEDIVPTILNYLELPIPIDTDGKIIKGIPAPRKKVRYYNYLNHWLLIKPLHKLKG
jgi:predicted AlkP superfamily phosphohydrolase/phosphomutase